MIENMTPQPYPLYLVEEDGHETLAVLGWVAEKVGRVYRLSPVAVPLGDMGSRPAMVDGRYAVYSSQELAEVAAERQYFKA